MQFTVKPANLSSDPVEVFWRLVGEHEYCFLLETLADENQPQTSGQSYIGVAPKHHFAAKDDRFYVDGKEEKASNPYEGLKSHIEFDKALLEHYMGGLVGYMSHE